MLTILPMVTTMWAMMMVMMMVMMMMMVTTDPDTKLMLTMSITFLIVTSMGFGR